MNITFECKSCGQSIEIDKSGAGELVDCPKCGTTLEVPYKSKTLDKAVTLPISSEPRSEKQCPLCGELILAVAKKCKHCGSMLDNISEAQKVTVTGKDPFAVFHTAIQGKKKGKLTILGKIGFSFGALMFVGNAIVLLVYLVTQWEIPYERGQSMFLGAVIGFGVMTAFYLWARK